MSLTQILKFDFGSNPSEFLDKLIEWEGLIDKYEQETLETESDSQRILDAECHIGLGLSRECSVNLRSREEVQASQGS